ncbi:hypothetical protein [Pseudonocardia adelaidensis]|uniref:hypothetical protein n=1 Tax=Pseudonocardia adelaidensis TaxID=648754 RepID=UPI003CD0649F
MAGLATSGTLTGEFLHRPITLRAQPRRRVVLPARASGLGLKSGDSAQLRLVKASRLDG